MSVALQSVREPELKGGLFVSAAFHAVIFAGLVFSTLYTHRGESWGGGGGGAISVGLVRNLPGVPLPRPENLAESRVVDETRGLYKEEPVKAKSPEESKAIPEFERNKPPKYNTRPSKILEDKTPPPAGAIPYGQGGAPALPYTTFTMPGAEGGMSMAGPGGEFGSRFPWFVEAVRRRISSNWLQTAIDPGIRSAPRAVVSFQINRDGSITNIQVLRSSGNAAVDLSAVRAIRDSTPLERLPSEYSGSHVNVEFWFDFKRP